MKKYIFDKARLNEWICPRIGRESLFAPENTFNAVGVEEDGEIIAAVLFEGVCTGARCSMHCAGVGKRWCTRTLLRICFEYAFTAINAKTVINTVCSTNHDSLRFTSHVGFKEMCRIKDGTPAGDLVIFALHRDECRWIGGKDV